MHGETANPIIMIEGNIGAGKSTFLKILHKNLVNVGIIFEPTNKWQHQDDDQNILNLFYKDTKRWAYTFQSYAFITRVNAMLNHQKQQSPPSVQFLERSVYCDRYCFAKNCFESGLMTTLEWQIYTEWFSWLAEKYAPLPSGFIYLKTDPTTCYNRMAKRRRNEESAITIEYLTALDRKHNEWLIEDKDVMPHLKVIPILVLDCNEEFENNIENQKKHLLSIKKFLNEKIIPLRSGTIKPIQSRI